VTLLTVEQGRHEHDCKGLNKHLLPLNARDTMFFVKGVLAYNGVEEFHKKVLTEMSVNCSREGRKGSRLETMTLKDAQRLARKLQLRTSTRQGS
jgi:hypothetical protein